MRDPRNESAPTAANGRGAEQTHGSGLRCGDDTTRYHVAHATAAPLLARLQGVQKVGSGWRARCPSCGGTARKLSVAVNGERVLLHCFAGCDGGAVLAAAGLRWSDLQPPRGWPQSPEEQRQARRALREASWSAALSVLALEATVLHLAALHLDLGVPLAPRDQARLALACTRIERAGLVLIERPAWKPDHCYPPARLVQLKRDAAAELERQHLEALAALRDAESALDELQRKERAA